MVRGGEGRNSWSDIQPELLGEILQKLFVVDYLNCQRVCRSWRRLVKDAIATKGTCPPAPQFPFLMLFPCINSPGTLSDITHENTSSYTIPTQTWKWGYFDFERVFSVQGWLVFQKLYYKENQNYDLLLFSNPVSGEVFELPPLFLGQNFYHKLTSFKLVFSSAPLDSSDFFVVACATLHSSKQRCMQQLAFCKVTDKRWTIIPTDRSQRFPFDEFIILDWKLYAMSKLLFQSGSVTLFNLRDTTFEKLKQKPIPMGRRPITSVLIDGLRHNDYEECRLARDGDEILLVVYRVRSCAYLETKQINEIIGFRIFKSKPDHMGDFTWIEVDDLGNRVLLMDCARVQVISAKENNLTGRFSGGNCVFFCITKCTKCDLGVFSFKDKRITRFPISHSSQVPGRRCLWFLPSPW